MEYRLDEQIRQAILLLEPKWTAKGAELDLEMDAIEFLGNSSVILHVWTNLIGNAIKFTPENSTVTIRLTEDRGAAVFTVDDEAKAPSWSFPQSTRASPFARSPTAPSRAKPPFGRS